MATVTSATSGSSNSAAVQAQNPPPKLDLITIFKQIEKHVCQVSSLRGRCTGILFDKNLIVVPFHSIALKELRRNSNGTVLYDVLPIEISYNGTTYSANYLQSQQLDSCQFYDCCVFQIVDTDFTPPQAAANSFDAPEPGTKVYYAGFPLTQMDPSFHKGTVSSVEAAEHTLCFSIDAPVMPGNSGGPVFIQKNGQVQLVGMIFSELARIDPNFIRERAATKHLLEQGTFEANGLDYNAFFSKMIDTVFDNLSTGIGKVMSIRHVQNLLAGSAPPKEPSPFSIGFPVTKEEHLPGQLATDPVYLDWYHRRVKGKTLCVTIFGRMLDTNIDKHDEKVLRRYYEENILNNATKGHTTFQLTPDGQYKNLCSKIKEATPKGIKLNRVKWISSLVGFKTTFPDRSQEIDSFIALYLP